MNTTHNHNLVILSDVHLGSDLVQHARPSAPPLCGASQNRDADLCALLGWYQRNRRDSLPWRLVIAGDLVDFVGMSVSSPEPGLECNEEEQAHGLGSSLSHTLVKLRQVAEHHQGIFRALAEFVSAGNELVVIRGNHDIDFHWHAVQKEFLRLLARHAPIDATRVSFQHWFYYEEGRVYVEHGHQYDPYCSHEHLLHPVRPGDHKRSSRSLSDVLLRFVVRPTRGLTEAGHEDASIFDYIGFAFRLGFGGMLGLGGRFFRAVWHLLRAWYEYSTRAAHFLKEEHERRLRRFARKSRVNLEKLRRLLSLQRPPVTRNFFTLLSSVMLDRVVMVLGLALVVTLVLRYSSSWSMGLGGAAIASGGAALLGMAWYRRRGSVDPTDQLRESALRISQLFPAAFVIMGHTHMPERSAAGDRTTYVNLGCWAEQDLDAKFAQRLPPSRTHFVVYGASNETCGDLMIWDSASGPRPYEQSAA